MALYLTSDLHIGHANIIRFCKRPFRNVDHMNNEIVKRFNEVLTPEDTLLNLGDVVMGNRAENLKIVKRIMGKHILFPGNHDEPWIGNPSDSRRANYTPLYDEVFEGRIYQLPILRIEDDTKEPDEFGMLPVLAYANHFPYEGDSHDKPRYNDFRYPDEGWPLVHGHTHSAEKISRTAKGTLQIHVGVDAWDFRPVHIDTVRELIEKG
jgi:calcineurin-like phosphoesterase family protein